MAKNSVRQYDPVVANNLDIAGISLAEGVTRPSDVNNIDRTQMGQLAQYLAEMSYPTVGGTSDALTLTPTTALAALADKVVYTGTIASTNATTTPTLNVSALGSKVIRKMSSGTDVALGVGDLPAGSPLAFIYSTAANSSAGAWILVNPPVSQAAGTIGMFAMSAVPSGWLLCNGAAISRTAFASLFLAIGTTYGAGDGSTTFNVPNALGYFPRAWNGTGSGPDYGRTIGSTQADAIVSHTHTATVNDPTHAHTPAAGEWFNKSGGFSAADGGGGFGNVGSNGPTAAAFTGITVTNSATGGAETRGINIAFMFAIKT